MTVRREAARSRSCQVHYDEGIANHIGPEPCVVGREAGGEASAGAHIGQALSRERINWDADVCHSGKRNGSARRLQRERMSGPAWSKTLACAYGSGRATRCGRASIRPGSIERCYVDDCRRAAIEWPSTRSSNSARLVEAF